MPGERLPEEAMAMRAVKKLQEGMVVNLGVGLPTYCSSYIPEDKEILLHAENGVLGYGPVITEREKANNNLVNASAQPVSPKPGMAFFDHAEAFAMIRGGHVDIAVLGAYEVSEKGDLASLQRPGKELPGVLGGGMDLAFCAKKVIALMSHTTKTGAPKIVKRCSALLTAPGCVNLVITDVAVIEVAQGGLVLREVAPGWSVQEVQAITEPELRPAPDLKEITLL